jgi:hypothetical protein
MRSRDLLSQIAAFTLFVIAVSHLIFVQRVQTQKRCLENPKVDSVRRPGLELSRRKYAP